MAEAVVSTTRQTGSRIRSNVARLLSGNIVFAASQLALVIVVARIAGPEGLGIYALANAIASPVFAFAGLGLRASVATDVERQHTLADYRRLYLVANGLGLLVVAAFVAGNTFSPIAFAAILAFAVARAAENGSQLVYGVLQRRDRISALRTSLALRGVLSIVAATMMLSWLPGRVDGAIVAIAVAWLVVLSLFDYPLVRGGTSGKPAVRDLFITVLPLGLLALLASLILNTPRYAVETLLGTEALGYYAAIMQIAAAGLILVNAIGQAVVPRLAELFSKDRREYLRLLTKAIAAAFGIGVAGMLLAALAGAEVMTLIYTDAFADQEGTLLVAMLWATLLFVSTMLGVGMTAMRSFRAQFMIGCLNLAVTVTASLLFIPVAGLPGAAAALCAGCVVKIVCQFGVLRAQLGADGT